LQLLAEKLVQLHSVESISQETIRQVLAHNELKPWLKSQWCIPCAGYLAHPFRKIGICAKNITKHNPLVLAP